MWRMLQGKVESYPYKRAAWSCGLECGKVRLEGVAGRRSSCRKFLLVALVFDSEAGSVAA